MISFILIKSIVGTIQALDCRAWLYRKISMISPPHASRMPKMSQRIFPCPVLIGGGSISQPPAGFFLPSLGTSSFLINWNCREWNWMTVYIKQVCSLCNLQSFPESLWTVSIFIFHILSLPEQCIWGIDFTRLV